MKTTLCRAGGALCVTLILASALALPGCGGDEAQTSSPAGAPKASGQAPVNADGSIAAQEDSARAAGRLACHGMAPLAAAMRFESGALRSGVTKHFAKLVTEPTPRVEASPGYPRLVAALYATTVPVKGRAEAAAGCAEMLAAD
jgi:hypothetical protein